MRCRNRRKRPRRPPSLVPGWSASPGERGTAGEADDPSAKGGAGGADDGNDPSGGARRGRGVIVAIDGLKRGHDLAGTHGWAERDRLGLGQDWAGACHGRGTDERSPG